MVSTLAIVGRPNVGKSTLFNKLTLGRKTIVHDSPGVTRDYTISPAQLGDLKFNLIDSAGLFGKTFSQLDELISAQTLAGVGKADVLLFMVDAQVGLTGDDIGLAKDLRKAGKHIILVINKCDNKRYKNNLEDFYRLGFRDIAYISAEHKLGFDDLLARIQELPLTERGDNSAETQSKDNVIKIAVIGKPNTGKSTLINRLLAEERLLTSDMPGVTRDAITSHLTYKNFNFEIVDTAGLRKKSRINQDSIEQYSISQTVAVVNTANVVILLNDINQPLQKQDLKIAEFAVNEGKPIILLFNKIDLFKDLDKIKKDLSLYTRQVISDIKDIPIAYISAKKDRDCNKVLDLAAEAYNYWNITISKKELNEWLEYATELHPVPLSSSGRQIKLKYIRQTAVRPPSFKIFGNIVEDLPKSYIRYLKNSLQKSFNLKATPIRIEMQKGYNPYIDKVK